MNGASVTWYSHLQMMIDSRQSRGRILCFCHSVLHNIDQCCMLLALLESPPKEDIFLLCNNQSNEALANSSAQQILGPKVWKKMIVPGWLGSSFHLQPAIRNKMQILPSSVLDESFSLHRKKFQYQQYWCRHWQLKGHFWSTIVKEYLKKWKQIAPALHTVAGMIATKTSLSYRVTRLLSSPSRYSHTDHQMMGLTARAHSQRVQVGVLQSFEHLVLQQHWTSDMADSHKMISLPSNAHSAPVLMIVFQSPHDKCDDGIMQYLTEPIQTYSHSWLRPDPCEDRPGWRLWRRLHRQLDLRRWIYLSCQM